ncbi:MAG: phospholipase D-like domain-containing protein [Acidimicrobiales bacterium]
MDLPQTSGHRLRNGAIAAGLGVAAVYGYGMAKYRRTSPRGFDLYEPAPPGTAEFARMVSTVTGALTTHGNRVEVLRNGTETFPAMLDAIAGARRTVDFSSYIYWPGEITDRFTDVFADRARAGVEVNIVLDGYGSAKLDRAHVQRLERAGAHVAFFLTPRWYNVHKLNNRMHRRLLVVDGEVGFAGGVGIADVWTGDAEDPEHWRETHLRVEGPAVGDILAGFAENWTEATRHILGSRHLAEVGPFDDGVDLQVVRSSPTTAGTASAPLFYAAIAGAQKRLWLTTAYFAAGEAFIDALPDAARRGVDVRLLTNGPNVDKEVVRRTGQRKYGPLLDAGVRVFEYQPTMLHAKVLIVDGWANVGSANFDHRSFGLDSELSICMSDPGTVEVLAEQFTRDVAASEELTVDQWRNRPLRTRAIEAVGEVFRQSL